MKKLRLFDSLKFVLAAVACMFILNVAHAATLPAGYTELEYLQTDGNAYIDTGILLSNTDTFEITFQSALGTLTSPVMGAISGGTSYTSTNNLSVTYNTAGGVNAYSVYCDGNAGNAAYAWNGGNYADKLKHTIKYNGLNIAPTIDGVAMTQTTGNTLRENTPTVTTWLFGRNTTGAGAISQNGIRIYDFYVYNKGHFIPARRDSDGVLGMYDLADANPATAFHTNAGTGEFVAGEWQIKIATTKYNEQQFAPVQNELSNAMNVVDDVVTRTMSQAQAIDTIATTKQTRPDESCPPFKKCLLVEDEDGTPHWYQIYDPINDFLRPILAAAGLSGNQGAPVMTTHTENGSTLYDTFNGFYNGSGAFRKKYIDNTTSAADRPFGPTTLPRCADDATRTTSTVNAGICYNTGGMFRTLTEGADDDSGEWALVWNGNEGGASLGITPGVVYGIAKCTTVGQHTTEMTGDVVDGSNYWWPKKLTAYSGGGTTLASLIEQYPNSDVETVFNTLPNPYGTDDNPEYPRENFRNCWCKMTAIGVGGSGDTFAEQAANGTIMSVSGGWVFGYASTSATNCANLCAFNCANYVRAYAAFRRAVLGVGAN